MPLKRLAFTLLVLAKYQDQRNATKDSVIFFDIATAFSFSNTCATTRHQLEAIRTLREMGLIAPLIDDIANRGHRVCFVDSDSDDVELMITDMRDLGYQYEQYCGVAFSRCALCGRLIRATKDKKRYCNSCKMTYGLYDTSRVSAKGRKLAMVKCVDCGCNFVVDSRAFGIKKRCDSCQKKHRLLQRQKSRKANDASFIAKAP